MNDYCILIFVILLLIIVVIALTLETPCDILWLGLFHQSTLCELLPSLESNSIVPSKNSTQKGNQRLFLPQRKGFKFLYIQDHMGISKSVAVLWLRLAMQQRAEEDYHLGQAKEVPTGDVQVLVGRVWRTPGDMDCDIVCIWTYLDYCRIFSINSMKGHDLWIYDFERVIIPAVQP